MIIVKIDNKGGKDGLERALKLLKRKFNDIKIPKELKKRMMYSKPSVVKREKIKKSIKRNSWKLRNDNY